MVKIKKNISQLSRSKEIVFISGESGTGKDLIAKHIHCKSDRKRNPFIKSSGLTFFKKLLNRISFAIVKFLLYHEIHS
jgi:transcriptional regulator with PAS, ATPase and Fis domain